MPRDSEEANNLIYTSLNNKHPFAIRYPKVNLEDTEKEGRLLDIGTWKVIKDGKDGTIITKCLFYTDKRWSFCLLFFPI